MKEKEEQEETMTINNDVMKKEVMQVEEKKVKNKEKDMLEAVTEVKESEYDLRHKTRVIPGRKKKVNVITKKLFHLNQKNFKGN